mmetsp:Transcript_9332/g.22367  ORF Transcript_9332/g.22367 Transcript_9332/m.22367 type:complete len:385 (+) Transcript_9332:53-1207(+)
MVEAYTCSGCNYTSFSKMLFQDHNCSMTQSHDPISPSKRPPPPPPPPPTDTLTESPEDALSPTSPAKQEALGIPDFDDSDLINPEHAPYRCICGYTAFSQLLFEDHECKFVMKEAIRSSVKATTVSRLKEAGLQVERHFARETAEQGPQTVIVKSMETGKVIWGPKPVEKATTIARLQEMILEARGQPWASMQLYHKDKEVPLEILVGSIFERVLAFQAEITSASMDIHVRKTLFNKFPDVITEVVIRGQKEDNFKAYVATIQEQLRSAYGRFWSNSSAPMKEEFETVDAVSILKDIEDKPKNLSCVPFRDCLSQEQFESVSQFLANAGQARFWKYASLGQHYVMAWAAGHEFRLSIVTEDGPSRHFVSTMSRGDNNFQRHASC